ncbi:hypothetical protein [Acuticoccus sp.]|uniref:hypothetical protein n=1 Tax=Acuticoccus sp. TaxID=1904378 RepID=UPI003B51888D
MTSFEKFPIRLDLLPSVPANAVVNELQRTIRFVIDTEFNLVRDRVRGHVEAVVVDGGRCRIVGWAADEAYKLPPPYVFALGRRGAVLGATNVFTPRPDVAQALGASVDEFGFQLEVRLEGDPTHSTLSLWALLQGLDVGHFTTIDPTERRG